MRHTKQNEEESILNLNISKRISFVEKVQFVCILYIATWSISPVLSYGTIYRVFAIIATLLWFLVSYSLETKVQIDVILAISYILITAIINYFYHGSGGILRNFQLYIFIFFYIVYRYYENKDISKIKFMMVLLIILFCIWNTATVNAYSDISNISRMMSKSFEGAEGYAEQGIGGFGLIYSQIILVPIVVYSVIRNIFNKIWIKLLFIYYIIITSILILKAGFALAIINLLVTICMYIIVSRKNPVNILCSLTLMIFLFIIFYINYDKIFMFLMGVSKGTSYYVKVLDLYTSFVNDTAVGSYSGRLERYLRSLTLFMKSPFWGQLSYADIGKHSPILDNFAQYGILTGVVFVRIILSVPFRFMKISNGKMFRLTFAVFVSLLIHFSTNNIPASMGVSLFIIYPTIVHFVLKREGVKYVN